MTPPDIIQQLRQVGEAHQSLLDAVENTLIHNHVECMSCVAFLTAEGVKSSKALATFPSIVQAVEAMGKPVTERADEAIRLLRWVHKAYADRNLSFADNWYADVEYFFADRQPNRETSTPAMTAGAEGQWQPIETAKEGIEVWVAYPHSDGHYTVFMATKDRLGWDSQYHWRLHNDPVAWMHTNRPNPPGTPSPQPKAGQAVDDEIIIELLRPYLHFGTRGWRRVAEAAVNAIRPYLTALSPPTAQDAVPDADIITIMTAASYWHDNPQGNGKGMELHKYCMEAAISALRQHFTVSIGRKP